MKNQEKQLRYIFITAKNAGAGKDTVVDILNKIYQTSSKDNLFLKFRFAAPILLHFQDIFEVEWDKVKNDDRYRNLLINFSRVCKDHDPNIWIMKTIRNVQSYENIINKYRNINIIFTDCRYQYEYEILGKFLSDYKTEHTKSTLLVEVIDPTFDGVIKDRDNIQDAIKSTPDILIINEKLSLDSLKEQIEEKLGFIFE